MIIVALGVVGLATLQAVSPILFASFVSFDLLSIAVRKTYETRRYSVPAFSDTN